MRECAPHNPFPIEGDVWGALSPLQKCFHFWGLEMRIVVHSPARMSVCVCTIIRPGPDLWYAYPVWHSCWHSRLEFVQKKALTIFPAGEYATNHWLRRNTESRRQQLSQFFFKRSWVCEEGCTAPCPHPMDPPLAAPSNFCFLRCRVKIHCINILNYMQWLRWHVVTNLTSYLRQTEVLELRVLAEEWVTCMSESQLDKTKCSIDMC